MKIDPDFVYKKTRKGKLIYFYNGQRIKRGDYWISVLKKLIKDGDSFTTTFYFNADDCKKLVILMKMWNLDTPAKLLKNLLNEYFSLLQMQTIQKKIEKKLEKKPD